MSLKKQIWAICVIILFQIQASASFISSFAGTRPNYIDLTDLQTLERISTTATQKYVYPDSIDRTVLLKNFFKELLLNLDSSNIVFSLEAKNIIDSKLAINYEQCIQNSTGIGINCLPVFNELRELYKQSLDRNLNTLLDLKKRDIYPMAPRAEDLVFDSNIYKESSSEKNLAEKIEKSILNTARIRFAKIPFQSNTWTNIYLRVLNSYIDHWQEIHNNYMEVFRSAFFKSISSQLDPYSEYLSPKEAEELHNSMGAPITGVGLLLAENPTGLWLDIKYVFQESNLINIVREKDRIFGVYADDDVLVLLKDVTKKDLIKMILGPANSSVCLFLSRSLNKPEKLCTERTLYSKAADYLSMKIKTIENKRYAVVKIDQFYSSEGHSLAKDFYELLIPEINQIDGLLVDLRGNGGGSLIEANQIIELLKRPGQITAPIYARSSQGEEALYTSLHSPMRTSALSPNALVFLLDAGSASASELLAGSLQSTGDALVLGETSYGKGSVQNIFKLSNQSKEKLRLTIFSFHFPNGLSPQGFGVIPDIQIGKASSHATEKSDKELKFYPIRDRRNRFQIQKREKEVQLAEELGASSLLRQENMNPYADQQEVLNLDAQLSEKELSYSEWKKISNRIDKLLVGMEDKRKAGHDPILEEALAVLDEYSEKRPKAVLRVQTNNSKPIKINLQLDSSF